jgi:hypothetical protein
MARRSAYAAVGPFKVRYSFYADVEMCMRLNLRFPVAYVAEPLIRVTPRESDRPYAHVNWSLERGLVAMREEIANGLYRDDPVAAARNCRRLRRMRDRRWLWQAGSCIRRRLDPYRQALALFRSEDSVALRTVALMGWPLAMAGGYWRDGS